MYPEFTAWWLCLAGLFFVGYGAYGTARKRITTKGKSGSARTYAGRDAVKQGVFVMVLGLMLIATSLIAMMDEAFR